MIELDLASAFKARSGMAKKKDLERVVTWVPAATLKKLKKLQVADGDASLSGYLRRALIQHVETVSKN